MLFNKWAIKLIKLYQKDKDRPHRCRHLPSCSNYGLECFEKFNFIKASFLTGYRILRCNPLNHKVFASLRTSKVAITSSASFTTPPLGTVKEHSKAISSTPVIHKWEV